MSTFNIIVATDSNFGIAKDGNVPWYSLEKGNPLLKKDLQYFKQHTEFSNIVMGRKTWESLPRQPLPNRLNYVLTRQNNSPPDQDLVIRTQTIPQLGTGGTPQDFWIIGGEEIYRLALNTTTVNYLYLTFIDRDFNCDKHFPMMDLLKKYSTHLESCEKFEQDGLRMYQMVIRLIDRQTIAVGEAGYLNTLSKVITTGEVRETRNARTYSLFGETLEFNLERFPLLTTKQVFLRGIFEELMFFIRGQTDSTILSAKNVRIWEPNTTREFLNKRGLQNYPVGEIGPMYGYNWRHFGNRDNQTGFDQLQYCLDLIVNDPTSRRIIMTTFDPAVADKGVLYPCHGISIQFYVSADNKLSCIMSQRSGDIFLGVPFNIASYSLLVYLICHYLNNNKGTKLSPGKLIINFGDIHLYDSHLSAAYLQLLKAPGYPFPKLTVDGYQKSIEDYEWTDITIKEYQHAGRITAEMIA